MGNVKNRGNGAGPDKLKVLVYNLFNLSFGFNAYHLLDYFPIFEK